MTYLDDDLGSEPLILQPSTGTPGTWEADSSALSQPGPWQADLLVRRQGQDDVRSTMRFPVVALPTGTAQTDSSAAYPPVPSWLPLGLGGAVSLLLLGAVIVVQLRRRTRRQQVPLESEGLRALLRGRDPFDVADVDRAHGAVGAGQSRRTAQRAMREKASDE